jgi:molybdopterin-guanine dinucleotide biosynthesis protein A
MIMTPFPIPAYVLAGGASKRFGKDKALVDFGGKPMLRRIYELLAQISSNVKMVARQGRYSGLGIEIVEDRWPGEGPLGGIITALEHSAGVEGGAEWNLIVGCDMPFLTRDWLTFLIERASQTSVDVLLPKSAHGPEPLCACYRTDAAPVLRNVFDQGIRKVTQALTHVQTELLDEAQWKRFDSAGRLLWNMNTAADYENACRYREINANE